ncbi:hypothetical protein PR048_023397 [Dryococelus australis]|uniref:Reverse transcriptase n=1 Tax=Dryococelus australis TaxID=614101 RepID=A0ABQ9GTZ3_9NEOP|nr:hypothetical protein PR048_023397 [Dryococelus australis]
MSYFDFVSKEVQVSVSEQLRLEHLSDVDKRVLTSKYDDVFLKPDQKVGCTDKVINTIDTGEARPMHVRPYRVPQTQQPVLNKQKDATLEAGMIVQSKSPWSAPIILVTQKRPDEGIRVRPRIDLCQLNSVTKQDVYPLPLINDTLDTLGGAKKFSTRNCVSGY